MTIKLFSNKFESVLTATSWYLANLAEARGRVPAGARPGKGNWVTANELGNELGNKKGFSMTQKEKKHSAAIDSHIQGGNLENLFSEIPKFHERSYCSGLKAEWKK